MKRKISAVLAGGLLLLSIGPAQADPSGIRYDASTHTYTNVGSTSAHRSAAPAATSPTSSASTSKSSKDADFVEYTLSPGVSAARTASYPANSAPVAPPASYSNGGGTNVQVVNASPSAVVYGSGYSAFDGGFGYGGFGYGGFGYGGYGYGGYGYGGYGYPGGFGYGRNINVNSLRPISTTTYIPFLGNVTNTYIPGFGMGNLYGFGGGFGSCNPWRGHTWNNGGVRSGRTGGRGPRR